MIVLDMGPGQPGEAVDDQAVDAVGALRLCRAAGVNVARAQFGFNGVTVTVEPGDTPALVAARAKYAVHLRDVATRPVSQGSAIDELVRPEPGRHRA